MSTEAEKAAVDRAFKALETYQSGSSRGALLALDQAVIEATSDAAARADLELRLVKVLRGPASTVAKEYACGKLAVIGGPGAVEALGELLPDLTLAHAATNALQVIPGAEAGKVLGDRVGTLSGLRKVGVITALGLRRDAASEPILAKLLLDPDVEAAAAAAGALGEIGTRAAAMALEAFLPHAPGPVRAALADACLAGAERLTASGQKAPAQALVKALIAAGPPEHVRVAATRLAPP